VLDLVGDPQMEFCTRLTKQAVEERISDQRVLELIIA